MARWLYLLSIPTSNIQELRNRLVEYDYDPIISQQVSPVPISSDTSRITVSVDLQFNTRRSIVEAFFEDHRSQRIGKPIREQEQRKIMPTKFFRYLRKYAKRKWAEGVAIYLTSIFAVGGFEFVKLLHKNFPEEDVSNFPWAAFIIFSALPTLIHILYTYAAAPRETEIKI